MVAMGAATGAAIEAAGVAVVALVATFFTDLVVLAAEVLIVLIPVELFYCFKRTPCQFFAKICSTL